MHNMKKYLQLLRVKQYIKNALIFLPAFFEGTVFQKDSGIKLIIGFAAFSVVCSAVYICNDLNDIEKDKMHPVKRNRPIASGLVDIHQAIIIAVICGISGYIFLSLSQGTWIGQVHIYVIIYFALNMGYSYGLKNIPILDVMILASGFLIRVLYGAALCNTWVSSWLYLTILMISIYMGTGKRKNERISDNVGDVRTVLKYYSVAYLEKIMQMCVILAVVFYSLWSANMSEDKSDALLMVWTVPLVVGIIMRYEMVLENKQYGDPTDILFSDKALQLMILAYGIIEIGLLYR